MFFNREKNKLYKIRGKKMGDKYIKKVICFGDSNTHGYNSKTMGRFSEEENSCYGMHYCALQCL